MSCQDGRMRRQATNLPARQEKPSPPKRERLHPSARRVLLMEAAVRTFARLGFAGTRMDDVAEEAGVAKGLLYRHFPSKEALFQAIMQER